MSIGKFVRTSCVATIFSAAAICNTSAALFKGDTTTVGLIEINQTPTDRAAPLADLFGREGTLTLRDLVEALRNVATDAELEAVVVRLRDSQLSTTQVEELSAAMDVVRAAGKKVHLFADAYSTPELILGSHADEVIVQSGGGVSLPGLYSEEMYFADTLNWVGVQPDFVQVGDFKGASEPMSRNGPSPQWDQNISQLLDGLYANIRTQIKTGRKLDDAKLDAAMESAVMADGETGKRHKLIDTTLDLPDLESHLAASTGGEIEWVNLTEVESDRSPFDTTNPFAIFGKLMRGTDRTPSRDTLAILHIDGPIVDGESQSGGLFGGTSVGSITIRRSIQEIEDEPKIKGVIVRIDSPGGSAIASEVIWQGLSRLSKTKPVWVSIGSMAASGGYYIAVSGEKIYANPSSIVGSIGVVGGKLAMGGLYEKLKVSVVSRSRGPMGGVLGSAKPWSEAERLFIRQRMTDTYDLFTRRVSAGRAGIELAQTAEGRLFTGNVAISNKMIDKVGGLSDAVDDLAKRVGLTTDEFDLMDYPAAPGFGQLLGSLFGSMASAPVDGGNAMSPAIGAISLLREVVGPQAWPTVRDNISALMQLRNERVLLVSPRVLIFR